jgi:O-antigen ligase
MPQLATPRHSPGAVTHAGDTRRRRACIPAWPVPALLALAVFAFGSVYPSGYWPLAGACAVVGLAGLVTAWRERPTLLLVLFGLVAAAIAFQLLPIPATIIARVSPATDAWLLKHDLLYAFQATAGEPGSRALSLTPVQTRLALLLYVAFAVFAAGLSAVLSRQAGAARTVAGGLVLAGAVLAVVGLAQRPVFGEKLYGIWDPLTPGASPFGPFVNRNHFAGWMLMALPVGLGYLAALVSRGVRHARPGWRGALLWLGGRDATQALLVAVGVGLMMLTLVFNLSRSGVGGLVIALSVMGLFSLRHQSTAARKVTSVAYIVVLSIGVAAWAGADVLTARFAGHDGLGLASRQEAWRQARAIAADFPLAGTGLNTYGLVVPAYEPADQQNRFYAAHNDYLQLAAEGGLLVTVPALLLAGTIVILAGKRIRAADPGRTTHWIRLGAVTGLLAIACQSVVEFSLQIPANAMLCAALCALATHDAAPTSARRRQPGADDRAEATARTGRDTPVRSSRGTGPSAHGTRTS